MNIITIGDNILRQKSRIVEKIDKEILKTISQMEKILIKEKGVGLAAPQVGVSLKIILIKPEKEVFVFINPEITYKSDKNEIDSEGCLSIPNVYIKIPRSSEIKIKALNLNGEEIELKVKGFFARVLQHEIDHLDGILMIDKIGLKEISI